MSNARLVIRVAQVGFLLLMTWSFAEQHQAGMALANAVAASVFSVLLGLRLGSRL